MKTKLPSPARGACGTRAFRAGLAGAFLILAVAASLPAATVKLQPGINGYAGAADAWLDESHKSDNYGGCSYLRVQYNSGMSDCTLVQFTLPSLSFQSLTRATLGLYYYNDYSMQKDNALGITPYRIISGMSWYENIYNGTSGHGVNWRYRDDLQTQPWTLQNGAWNDKVDDGNPPRKIKRADGTPPDAIAPPAWVTWEVQRSVAQWYGGQQNNGLVLYQSSFEGPGSIVAGLFHARENGLPSYSPYLEIAYAGANLYWSGAASAIWDNVAGNWDVGGFPGAYGDGDFVTFRDGASHPDITIAVGGVAPGSVLISNTATAYRFSGGSLGGAGPLVKQGAGPATLGAGNSYGGLTLVKAGTLIITAPNALGATSSGTVVSNGAALAFQGGVNYSSAEPVTLAGNGDGGGALYAISGNNRFSGPITLAAAATISCASGELALAGINSAGFGLTCDAAGTIAVNGPINGTGSSLIKNGSGLLRLSGAGASPYSGNTVIHRGTLALADAAAIPYSPVITVADGASLEVSMVTGGFELGGLANQTLQGGGSVSGDVTVQMRGRLEPGDSLGTLTFLGNLTLASGALTVFELTNAPAMSGGTNDLIRVGGDLAVDNQVVTIRVLGAGPLRDGSYQLFHYAGAKTGAFNPTPVFLSGAPAPGSTVWIDESVTNQIRLEVVTPVPTVTSVTTRPNPSLPEETVTLRALVNALNAETNVTPTGSVTFTTNGVPLGPPVPLDNGQALMDTAGLAHGLTPILAEYPGNSQFLGSTGSVVHLANTPPVPGPHILYVLQNEKQLLPVAALLAEDLDPDGDPLNLADVSALSTNGGPAALVGTSSLAWLPKPDYVGGDLLTYTLSDPYTSVTGAICFHVLAGDDLTNSVLDISNLGGGVMALTATGIPGWPYVVQSVPSLTLPLSWQTLGTNLANSAGWFQFTDTVATNLERYYRVFTAPNPTAWQIYDAELLTLETTGATSSFSVMLRESPSLLSRGVTLIKPSATSHCTISSGFDVFTEISLDQGHSWHPATNGPVSLILTGGLPLNQFPGESLPPLMGRYLSPPEQPELYSPGILIKDLALHGFSATFAPPNPGEVLLYHLDAMLDFWVSFDGGQTFQPHSAPARVVIQIKCR